MFLTPFDVIDNPFKDFSRLLPAMRIMMDVSDRLVWTPDNVWKLSIEQAVKNNVPYLVILKEIKEQATSNRLAVEGQIGVELTKQILAF